MRLLLDTHIVLAFLRKEFDTQFPCNSLHRHSACHHRRRAGTRDPFDRLLLAQCQTEGLLLVTVDRALAGHRLAFKF